MAEWTTQCSIEDCTWTVELPETRCLHHGGDPERSLYSSDALGGAVSVEQEAEPAAD